MGEQFIESQSGRFSSQQGTNTVKQWRKGAESRKNPGHGGAVMVGNQYSVGLERGHGRQDKALSGPNIMMLF